MRIVLAAALIAALAGCGGHGKSTSTQTAAATNPAPQLPVASLGQSHHPRVGKRWHYQVRVTDGAGPNRIPMTLKTQMYLGERWEVLLVRDGLSVRAFATSPLTEGEHQVEFPAQALWIF